MLIDAGNNDDADLIKSYLKNQNIEELEYVIGTHPHEDHIGNMSYIINNYDVINFYSPKVTTTSNSFEKLIDALQINNLKIKILKANTSSINLGKYTTVEVLSPNLDYYENLIEQEVLSKNYNLKSDILKVGHHGSSTSTSKDFYESVNPSISIISVGNNSYGHPTNKTLNQIKTSKVYRTDEDGDIVITSDGNSFK